MAIPLRDSWLAHALGGTSDEHVSPRGLRATQNAKLSTTGDPELVNRLRAGDVSAFTDLVASVVPALTQYAARHLRDDAGADDVVQDVLVRLWARRTTLTVTTTVRAYLFGAVRNAVFNVHKHQRVVTTHAEAEVGGGASSGANSPADQLVDRLTVDQLLAYLPDRRREAVVLRYLGALSYAEIAVILAITPSNAERLVARSLETLRDIAARHGGL